MRKHPWEKSKKSSEKGKRHYDQGARGALLQTGDCVLVKNLSKRGGLGKLRSYSEQKIHCAVEKLGDGHAYRVQAETSDQTLRVLHHNLLLSGSNLPKFQRLMPLREVTVWYWHLSSTILSHTLLFSLAHTTIQYSLTHYNSLSHTLTFSLTNSAIVSLTHLYTLSHSLLYSHWHTLL